MNGEVDARLLVRTSASHWSLHGVDKTYRLPTINTSQTVKAVLMCNQYTKYCQIYCPSVVTANVFTDDQRLGV